MTELVRAATREPKMRLRIGGGAVLMFVLALAGALLLSPSGPAAPTSPAVVLDQCRNGAFDDPNDCVVLGGGSAGWVNGNAGKTNAHFIEGHSIPYRAVMKNVPTDGSQQEIVLGYDIRHSSKNALDFLTYYDNLEPHLAPFGHNAETVTPPSGTGLDDSDDDTAQIPRPTLPSTGGVAGNSPNLRFTTLRGLGLTKMAIFGGEFVGEADDASIIDAGNGAIAYVQQGSLAASQAQTQIRVRFRDTDGDGLVVLGWGGHIARSTDWGLGNSASSVSGSPYHMALISWTLGSVGQQDRSLKTDAVFPTGAVQIVKNIQGGTPDGTFGFTGTGSGIPATFNLTTVSGTASVEYAGIVAGTKTVTENAPSGGFQFVSVACTDPDTGSSVDQGLRKATIDVDDGEVVVCTFTNKKPTRIKVIKDLIPATDGGKFNLQINGVTQKADAVDGDDTGFITVSSLTGNTVGEIKGTTSPTELADYNTTISCDNGDGSSTTLITGTPRSISLSALTAGTDTTCTITNTRRTFIIVTYVCEGSQLYSSSVTFPSVGGTLKASEAHNSASLPAGSTEAGLCADMDARFSGVTSGTGKLVKVDISP